MASSRGVFVACTCKWRSCSQRTV